MKLVLVGLSKKAVSKGQSNIKLRGFWLWHLKISELGELLPTFIQQARKGLCMLVSNLMGADIAPLSKPLLTDVTREWFFSCMASLMGLIGQMFS